jgi:uncharacterized protein YkwD
MKNPADRIPAAARCLMLFAAAGLAACGGGGSDTPTSSTIAPPAAAPAPGPAPAPSPAPAPAPTTAGSTCGIPDFAATALARMNQLRAAGADCRTGGKFAPAAALTWSALLTQSAEGLSQDMVAKNFFSHTGSNGSTLGSRVDATGYTWSGLGENIAAGYPSIDAVMTGWMASDGHCENLMNPAFNQVGLVCVPGTAANTYNTYWTMDLATSR